MRLPKPGFGRTNAAATGSAAGNTNRSRLRNLISLIVIVLLILGGWTIYHNHKNKSPTDENGNSTLVRFLKDSKTLNDQRSLASAYLAQGNYTAAEDAAKKVAQQSNDVNDYMSLLNICTVRNVPDKKACVDMALQHIKNQVDKLPFNAVYAVASELDEAGFGKDALVYYQQAYKIYPAQQPDPYTKTKDQIKQKMDQLNG
jgi:tetratricopeptide (TPR) repeat protein